MDFYDQFLVILSDFLDLEKTVNFDYQYAKKPVNEQALTAQNGSPFIKKRIYCKSFEVVIHTPNLIVAMIE